MEQHAHKLFEIFEENGVENPDGTTEVTVDGLAEMTEYFDEVPEEERAFVFLEFLQILSQNGFSYDVRQFLDVGEDDDFEFGEDENESTPA